MPNSCWRQTLVLRGRQDASLASVLGGPWLPGLLSPESPITHLRQEAATQRLMSRKNWPSEAANKTVSPGPQVHAGSDWPLGQRRARQLAVLPQSVPGSSGENCIPALNLSLLAHSATNMGMSITGTGKAIECCPPSSAHHSQEVKAQVEVTYSRSHV